MKDNIAAIDLSLDPAVTAGLLITFLGDQFEKKGFSKAVIGVSGGVDSALGVALLANSLGPENVFALALPAEQSDPRSLVDAKIVCDTFGVRLDVAPIGELVRCFFGAEREPDKNRVGNVAARLRMIRLYDASVIHRGLVIGTSNKTELLLGYGTWHGDLACSINPLGDLYKTQVWALADWLGVPERIVTKPPSADLWKGQTDEGELGFTYEEVDRLLYLLVDRDYARDDLISLGFEPEFIQRVVSMIVKSQFKRTLPVIPKISLKTIGIDFHFTRDWGR